MFSGKVRIKKEDKVKVLTGKDSGKIGKVVKVIPKKNKVVIENINVVKRHAKPNMQNRQGGIIEKEAPINISNVMLMCSHCVTPTRIAIKTLESGKKTRVCKKCNETIDA